jgi:CheY-like chemotaxis protein
MGDSCGAAQVSRSTGPFHVDQHATPAEGHRLSDPIENEFMRRRRSRMTDEGGAWPGTGGRTRVLIADRSRLLAEALMLTLELEPSLEPIGYALEGSDALELVEQLDPDVILVGTDLAGIEGLALAELVREFWPRTSVVMLARTLVSTEVDAAYAAGVADYVVCDRSVEQLLETLSSTSTPGHMVTRRAEHPISRIGNG